MRKRLITTILSLVTAFALVFTLGGCTAFGNIAHAVSLSPGTLAGGSATVLVYMNGSDLESYAGEATSDIAEMLESGIGDNANVVIETLGTQEWQDYGIASDHTQRYLVKNGELELVDDSLGQLDTTDPATLSDFISWGTANYPADRYMLVMWDHGAGPVYGFGYDEFQSEESALTLDEMQQALQENEGVHFDFIGMDCCIMSSLETCLVMAPYCDYTILSEDFEPGVGWSYTNWMGVLEENPSVSTAELGTAIVDDMIAAVEEDPENGEATLALIDESAVPALYTAWVAFAYENEDALLASNYSQEVEMHGRLDLESGEARPSGHGPSSQGGMGGHGPSGQSSTGYGHGYGSNIDDAFGAFGNALGTSDDYYYDDYYGSDEYGYGHGNDYGYGYGYDDDDYYGYDDAYGCDCGCCGDDFWSMWDYDDSYVTMSDYFITDIDSVASTVDNDTATALEKALQTAIVHYSATDGEENMAGLGVTLPYGDAEFYDSMVEAFTNCGIDADYIAWLEAFVNVA